MPSLILSIRLIFVAIFSCIQGQEVDAEIFSLLLKKEIFIAKTLNRVVNIVSFLKSGEIPAPICHPYMRRKPLSNVATIYTNFHVCMKICMQVLKRTKMIHCLSLILLFRILKCSSNSLHFK